MPSSDSVLPPRAGDDFWQTALYGLTHDLRTPLINILGFGQELRLLCEELKQIGGAAEGRAAAIVGAEIPECLGYIELAGREMDDMLTGLLHLSRLLRRPVEAGTARPSDLLAQLKSLHPPVRGIDLRIPQPLPPCRADSALVLEIFEQLLENTVKFARPQTAPIVTITAAVTDELPAESPHRSGRWVRYSTADNGLGFDPKKQDEIFRPLRKLRPGKSPGPGLGLAIVRGLAQRMGGWAWADGVPNEGATFHVALPVAE